MIMNRTILSPHAEPLAMQLRERFDALGVANATHLAVALSGGVDSLVLLHLLRFALLRNVEAVHFDHRMRAASDAEALWVRGLCRAWNVPLTVERAGVPLRSETAARAARYAFFSRFHRQRPGFRIATAHHADDQAETILLRMLRGSGILGLAGIPAVRGPFVRPLLSARRAAIEAYAADHGLRPRFDPTNLELQRPRGAIRHLVLPHLEQMRPGAVDAVLRLGATAADAQARLAPLVDAAARSVVLETVEGAILLARPAFLAYHPKFRAMLLRSLLQRLGCRPGRAGTAAALQFITTGRSGGRIALPGGFRIERSFERIALRRAEPADGTEVPVTIAAPGDGAARGRIGGRDVVVRWHLGDGATTADTEAFDPQAIRFPLLVRGWRPGDRIRLAYGTKKLKKLFGELRLDRDARLRTPVLVERRDRTLWVVGRARAVDATPAAAPALYITVTDG
jgi:tRNA(Ile)-lysidine synthase